MIRKTEFGQRLAWLILKPTFDFFLHFEVRGKENVENVPTNVIFALNHISEMDALMPSCAFGIFSRYLPIYCVALRHDAYKKLGTFRSFFYREGLFTFIGAYPMAPGVKDYEVILSPHIEFLKKGNSVEIFPEGGIRRPGKIREPRGGVIALAKITGLPIVPVALAGHAFTSPKEFFLRKRRSVITFGKPIFPEELFAGYENAGPEQYAEIAKEKIMPKIEELLEK
jgi:1-acyl-sn-glycerol-3-phosphate acyltransferase